MGKIVNDNALADIVCDIQDYIAKKWNPSIIEMELIIRMMNETIQKKRMEGRTNGLASNLIKKALKGEL